MPRAHVLRGEPNSRREEGRVVSLWWQLLRDGALVGKAVGWAHLPHQILVTRRYALQWPVFSAPSLLSPQHLGEGIGQ